MDLSKKAIALHKKLKGKIEVTPKIKIDSSEILQQIYTPGVAAPCLEIQKDITKSFELTGRSNTIAVITDGSAILGLGDIGPEAGMPVMEGKCALFKTFGNVNAVPICLKTKDQDELIRTIYLLSGSFGGINLEDISTPRSFIIERELQKLCDIPVFHDDQHGTAIVVGSACLNALKLAKKTPKKVKVVINGAGSAGIAIARHLKLLGMNNILICNRKGIIYQGMRGLNSEQVLISKETNHKKIRGTLSDALKNADIFIGVSSGNVVTAEMIKSMSKKAIVFPLANPIPEISYEEAKNAGAYIVGTGSSAYPNQINNSLVFPGVFRGALDARAKEISLEMQVSASYAIANCVPNSKLSPDYIIPSMFNKSVHKAVAKAVFKSNKFPPL